MVSKTLGYGKRYDNVMSGDIVMVPAGYVDYPAVKYRLINRIYLLFCSG